MSKSLGNVIHKEGREQIASPVGIVKESSTAAQAGWESYLAVLAFISLSLGLLNLLPLLPLDGGYIVFALAEKIRGHAIRREIYARVSAIGIALVLLAIVYMSLGRWLLPKRKARADEAEYMRLDSYYTELIVEPKSRWIGQPIRQLSETAHGIATGNFGERLPEQHIVAELADLSADFNLMAGYVEDHVAKLKEAARQNRELFISSIRAFAAAIDAKDPYTRGHSERVAELSRLIARELGQIAVIDHADLDRMAAEDLVESGVRAVVNVASSTST